MRFPILTSAIALCLALPTVAQDATKKAPQDPTKKAAPKEATAKKIQVFGGQSTRGCSTLVLFGDDMMAGMCITYGEPEWKDEYNSQIDMLKGKISRLGKDMWTTFMTSTPIEIGGAKVAAGSYVVGLHCNDAGTFSLAFLDSSKAMKDGLMPFGDQSWKPDVLVPLSLKKDVVDSALTKMTMSLMADKGDASKGTFKLAWGNHQLTAPLMIPAAK